MKIENENDGHDSSTAGGDPIDMAEARLRRLQKTLDEAEEAVAQAETALADIDESDPKAFGRAVAKKTSAVAQRDELRDRLVFAERAVEVAREKAAAAEHAALRKDLEDVEQVLRDGERVCLNLWFEFVARLREEATIQAEYAERAASIDVKLGNPPRRDRTYFGNIDVGFEVPGLMRSADVQREAQKAALEARAKKGK